MAVRQAKPPRAENKSNKIVKSKNKSENKVLLVAQEIKFAKTLAGNDKKARDKVLKNLKKWLTYRSASTFDFSEQDFMRLWKGLFYCVWMSDKPLIQEDLCESISQLFECFGDEKMETSALFYKCFLKTMSDDWFGIDQHRIDKFLMLVRRMTRGILRCGQSLQWSPHALTCIGSSLSTLLAENQGLGLQMHLADLWMEEVAKITEGKVNPQTVADLTKPFAEYLCYGQETRLAGSIMRHIFTHLIRQTDLGIDYQDKMFAWRHAGYPGGSVDAMEKVEESDDEEELGEEPEQESEDESGQPKRKVGLDARAGHVDAVLPQLPVDGQIMAKMLKDMISDPRSTLNNRTKLNSLVQSFETLASGEYPYKMKDVTMPNDPKYRLPKAGKSAVDLMVFEELHEDDEMKGMNKRQRRKFLMKQRKMDEEGEKNEDQPPPKTPSAPKKAKKDISNKVQPGVWQVEDVKESEDIRPDSSKNTSLDEKSTSVKKNQPKKMTGNRLNTSDSNVLKSQKNRLNILKSNLSLSSSPSRKKESKKNTTEAAIDFLKSVKQSPEIPGKETEDIRPDSGKITRLEEKDSPIKKNRNKKTGKNRLNTSDSDLLKSKKNRLNSLKSNLSLSSSPSASRKKELATTKSNTSQGVIEYLKSVKQTPETPAKESEDIRLDTTKNTTLEKKISPDKKNQAKKMDITDSNVLKSQKNRLNILKDLSLTSSPAPSRKKESIVPKSSTPKGVIDHLKNVKQSPEVSAKKSEEIKSESLKKAKLEKKVSPINKNQAKKMGLNRLNTSDSNILKSQKNRLNILKSNLSLSSTPSPSRKKVLIALKNNTSQGVIDYFKSVKQSPEIPFDGEKKPPKTALKPNTLPSPINPFYKKKLRLKF